MSHTTALKAVEMRDESILLQVAEQLKLKHLGKKEFTMYDKTKAVGHGFELPGWSQPLVINTTTGQAAYDNFNGHWGGQVELDKLCQAYAAESNRRQAAAQGYVMQEQYLDNGDLVQTFESLQMG